jgi:hypothetical protein
MFRRNSANGQMHDLLELVGVLGEYLAGKRNLGVALMKRTFVLQGYGFELGELGLAALGLQSPVDLGWFLALVLCFLFHGVGRLPAEENPRALIHHYLLDDPTSKEPNLSH